MGEWGVLNGQNSLGVRKAICWQLQKDHRLGKHEFFKSSNFSRSPFQARVIVALVSFFILSNSFSYLSKESIGFPDAELYDESFLKKVIEKLKYFLSSQDPKFSQCNYQQPYNFFYCCNYCWTDVSTMSIALFWWSRKFT